MTGEEELKTMIKCFRVVDLQVLLSFAGRSKVGKKHELQERALELLHLKSQPLALKIRQLYDSMQKGYLKNGANLRGLFVDYSPPSATDRDDGGGLEKDEISIIDVSDCPTKVPLGSKESSSSFESKEEHQTCPIQPNSSVQVSLNSVCLPFHPDVKFKKLPFYKVLYELLRPCSLLPRNFDFHQRNSFMFYITPQQAAAISHSRDPRPGCQNEFKVQGQLRLCLLETTSPQNDSFPAGLMVRVNNKFCYIQQENPIKKKKDVYVREISPPINITPLMKLNASEANKLDVQWNTECGVAYVVAVYLVQKKTSEDLVNRLKAKGVRSADYTKGMIKDKLNEEADSEILTTSLRVSLMCPLGKMRLNTPCRASTCQHLQCFDASLYIQMNEKKATWMCPVCDSPAEYDQLVIDGYFQEILSSDRLPSDVNEIELHSDGSWSSHVLKQEETSEDGNVFVKVETEEALDVIIEEKPSKGPSKVEGGGDRFEPEKRKVEGGGDRFEPEKRKVEAGDDRFEPEKRKVEAGDDRFEPEKRKVEAGDDRFEPEKRKVDEIDLTVSDDSDDEPLIYYKRRESSKNKRNGVFHLNSDANISNSVSNRSSPSVINLDSDSSDSLPLMISAQIPSLPSLI